MPGQYFKSQERRTEQIAARVPKRIKDELQKLARYWTAKEREENDDTTIEVTVADVVVRLLDVGLEGAWEEARAVHDEKTIDKMVEAVIRTEKPSKSKN
jgi:hypothetical protein